MFISMFLKYIHCVFVSIVGPLRVEFSDPVTLDLVRSENQMLQPGGRFKPNDCIAQHKVAMIIPFRNRDEHLKFWLYYLHPILQRQQLDYGVYVINQVGVSTSAVKQIVTIFDPLKSSQMLGLPLHGFKGLRCRLMSVSQRLHCGVFEHFKRSAHPKLKSLKVHFSLQL